MKRNANDPEWGIETLAIHAGQEPDPHTGAVTVPVYQTSTYEQDAVGQDRGYEYSRTGNPTRDALETSIASLEGGDFGRAFASGMAAEDTILRLLNPGDHVVMGNDAYGGTFRLISKVLTRFNIEWTAVNLANPTEIEAAIRDNTRILWTETPSNPLLSVVDIEMLASVAHANNAWCVVDNTFATPYLQQPLSLGADFVVHSATKYLGGHSDVVGGFIAMNSAELDEKIGFLQNAIGAVPAPWDCYLLLRGIKTLPVRMDRHCENAEKIVDFLKTHEKVIEVLYPGLESHQTHKIAEKQMKKYGGMVSFTVKGGEKEARRIVSQTKVFTLAESLGAVESLIEVPAAMTHLSAEGSPLEVDDSLIRLSVGIETAEDLLNDLSQALGH
ncbi:MAG: cystathionine gamma-synthase [Acidimicrobiaceae bacterium]|nr:cystathionine gamma-synthase [Acidimicrobiaceae bacterium]